MDNKREAAFAKYRDEQLGGVGGNWDGLDAAHFRAGFDAGYNARGEAGWTPIRTIYDLPKDGFYLWQFRKITQSPNYLHKVQYISAKDERSLFRVQLCSLYANSPLPTTRRSR